MNIQAPNVSGYVAEAADRAASQPSEAQARAQRDGSNVIQLPTAGLPAGKTAEMALARAVGRRKHLWYSHEWMLRSEEERLDELVSFCTRLYGGDATAGQLLASAALYA